ncbi:hypothetical protein SAMN05443661_12852, partial [Natronobacterium gregoryi]
MAGKGGAFAPPDESMIPLKTFVSERRAANLLR